MSCLTYYFIIIILLCFLNYLTCLPGKKKKICRANLQRNVDNFCKNSAAEIPKTCADFVYFPCFFRWPQMRYISMEIGEIVVVSKYFVSSYKYFSGWMQERESTETNSLNFWKFLLLCLDTWPALVIYGKIHPKF